MELKRERTLFAGLPYLISLDNAAWALVTSAMFFRVGRWGVWVAIFAGEVTWDTWDVAGVLSVCNYYMFVCFIV